MGRDFYSKSFFAVDDAKIPTPEGVKSCCIVVRDGKIDGLVSSPPASVEAVYDAKGALALPGLIDMHAHLRDWEYGYKEDFASGTASALAGGFTTVVDMPNTKPPVDTAQLLRRRIIDASQRIYVDVGFYAFPTKGLEEVKRLADTGALGFKVFTYEMSWQDVEEVMANVSRTSSLLLIHAEDAEVLERRRAAAKKLGREDVASHPWLRPKKAETVAVEKALELAHKTGCRLHICHVTTTDSAHLVQKWRQIGVQASCEVTPHHLMLDASAIRRLGGIAITNPPLRSLREVRSLWRCVGEGLVDALVTDHAPHALSEKLVDKICDIRPGIPGFETALPLMLTAAFRRRISLSKLVDMMCRKPAEILGLRDRGLLARGSRADLVLVDASERFRVNSSRFLSKAKYSPFDGIEVVGRVKAVFVRGTLAFEDGEVLVKKGFGEVVEPRRQELRR